MNNSHDRFDMLESRCSGFAASLLRKVQNHPNFPDVMAQLERIRGHIFEFDIEQALLAVASEREGTH